MAAGASGAVGALLPSVIAGLVNVAVDAPVVDQARVLAARDRDAIAARLRDLADRTGVQMAVLLIETTGDEPIEGFSIRTATAWGGGRRGRDDEVLFTLAVHYRRMRLEVGHVVLPALVLWAAWLGADGEGHGMLAYSSPVYIFVYTGMLIAVSLDYGGARVGRGGRLVL